MGPIIRVLKNLSPFCGTLVVQELSLFDFSAARTAVARPRRAAALLFFLPPPALNICCTAGSAAAHKVARREHVVHTQALRSLVGRRRRQVSLGRGGASASWMKRPKASSFATGGMTGRAAIVESWRQRRPHGPIIQVQKARFFEPRKIRLKEADFSSEKSRRVF